jgi:restriction system protein
VDIVLYRDGRRYLVQCKQWRSKKVHVATVRELLGVVSASGADGGFVVSAGEFTRSAVALDRQ